MKLWNAACVLVALAVADTPLQEAGANPLVGLNYQPYTGQWTGNPLAPPAFNSYTYANVLADLTFLKSNGYTMIKTYGVGTSPFSGNGDNLDSNQYNVAAAHALGMSVYLGANLQYANNALDVVRSRMEIDLAIKQAVDNPGTVKALIVGNESIGVNGVTVADMVSLMEYAKTQRNAAGFTATTLPVSTVQRWDVLAGPEHAGVSQAAEGAIYANIYPFFDNGTTIDTAITQFQADYGVLRNAINSFGLSGLPIAVGETGWATAGVNPVNSAAVTSVANMQRYVADYSAQATALTFLFEAFDEPWKAQPNSNSVESHFGVFVHPSGVGGPGPSVPEPSTALLSVVAAVGLATQVVRRQRRRASEGQQGRDRPLR